MKLDAHSLRLFVTVAEHLHFGRAARALAMSQPPLSQQIQRLEQRLGGRLFDRTNRSVRLTALGEAILADARGVLARLEQLERHADNVVRGVHGRLRVGYVGSSLELVAHALGVLHREHPRLELVLSRMGSPDQLAALRAGAIDVGVARLFAHEVSDLAARRLSKEHYLLAVPAGDALARARSVRIQDLAGRPFLAFERATQPALYDFIVATCARAGVALQIVQQLETKREIVALVAAGLGVGLVPESSKKEAPKGVTFVSVRSEIPPVELWAVTPRKASPWALRFVEAFAVNEPGRRRGASL